MMRLPLTVISGFLGAGKTTLINRLLAEDHGLKLMVLVNDFGAINIDQALISAQDDDVIALTNGCVCCTMGADLFMALGDALDRRPRPDHLIIEASGIADPAAIANTARAEPDLSYAGIITLVDADNVARLLDDALIAPQVMQQIGVADMVILTKSDDPTGEVSRRFAAKGLPQPEVLGASPVSGLLSGICPMPKSGTASGHGGYATWDFQNDSVLDHDRLLAALAARPPDLYRFKGFAQTTQGTYEVQVVGANTDLRRVETAQPTVLVGLGLAARISRAEIQNWWDSFHDVGHG